MPDNLPPLRIAPRYDGLGRYWTTDDWKKLDLTKEEDWQTAITIFESRIKGRYFAVIDKVKDYEFSGFAIMSLLCLLMETLEQFHRGIDVTPRKMQKEHFEKFLERTAFSKDFDQAKRKRFCDQIRHGLLHQAEIKENCRILKRSTTPLVTFASDGISLEINRELFYERMQEVFNSYIKELALSESPNSF